MGYFKERPINGIYSGEAYMGYIHEGPTWDIFVRFLYMG